MFLINYLYTADVFHISSVFT